MTGGLRSQQTPHREESTPPCGGADMEWGVAMGGGRQKPGFAARSRTTGAASCRRPRRPPVVRSESWALPTPASGRPPLRTASSQSQERAHCCPSQPQKTDTPSTPGSQPPPSQVLPSPRHRRLQNGLPSDGHYHYQPSQGSGRKGRSPGPQRRQPPRSLGPGLTKPLPMMR